MTDQIQPDIIETGEDLTCSITDVGCLGDWFVDQIASIGLWFWDRILSGMAAVIEAIPVPSWANNLSSIHIPPSVAWIADAFALDVGVAVIVSAYTIRFLIRRLPVIG